MKKLILSIGICILCNFFVSAQDTTHVERFDAFAEKLDKNQIITGILYDRVVPFARLNKELYTREELDSLTYGYSFWKQAYFELYLNTNN